MVAGEVGLAGFDFAGAFVAEVELREAVVWAWTHFGGSFGCGGIMFGLGFLLVGMAASRAP